MSLLNLICLLLLVGTIVRLGITLWRVRDWRLIFAILVLLIALGTWITALVGRDRGIDLMQPVTLIELEELAVYIAAFVAVLYLEQILISQKESALALLESQRMLEGILDNVPDVILTIDRQGLILYVNHSDSSYSEEEVTGSSSFDYLFEESQQKLRETLTDVFEHRRSVEATLSMLERDGSHRLYACRFIPSREGRTAQTATVIATNITQQKQDEEELRRSRHDLELRVAERTQELAKTNEDLRNEIIERKQTENQLSFRIEFERAISGISTRFINLETDQIDTAVFEALRTIGELEGVDHSYISRIQGSPPQMSMIYEWCREGLEPASGFVQNIPMSERPWLYEQLCNMQPVVASRLGDLPPEAKALRRHLDLQGLRSLIAVPLASGGVLWGLLGFAVKRQHLSWDDDNVALLKVVGEICLSALERKRTDEALRATEARLRRLFQSNIIGSIYTDVDGSLYDANDAFLNMTGYRREDLPLNWRQLTPPEWAHRDELAVQELLAEGIAPPREKEYIHKDGHRVPILIGIALLDKQTRNCIGFVIDLTERKQTAQRVRELTSHLESASRLSVMGEMTAGLAHELHQPLAVIANYANGCIRRLDKQTVDREKLIETLQEVVSQSIRAGEILRRIRDFIHQRETQKQVVDINDVIRDAAHFAELDLRQQQVKIELQLQEELPCVVGDPVQLTQVVLNLLINGIQATAENSGSRKLVTVSSRLSENRKIELSVRDSGPGIPESLRKHIFDQFFTTKPNGLGMGLSICKSTIDHHRGTLELSPGSNGGAEFMIQLPASLRQPQPGGNHSAIGTVASTADESTVR